MDIVDIISRIEEFKNQYQDAAENKVKATEFWNRYNNQPNEFLRNNQYQMVRDRMLLLLRTCQQIDREAFEKIHKGHPFFFIGISSYRLCDFQTALSFFDAALSEDLKFSGDDEGPTRLFFMLRGGVPYNAARAETIYIETKVERAINAYNKLFKNNQVIPEIYLQDMRDVFIKPVIEHKDDPGLRTLLTTFFTFVVEWDFRNEHFDLGLKDGTSEPFLMHLFRGCILFESLLKRNPYPKLKHDDQKNELVKRNVLAHSLAWEDRIDKTSYEKLYFHVITSCIHVINFLWRNSTFVAA